MRVGVVQIAADSVIPNATTRYEAPIASAAHTGCNIILFPELSDSGYDLEAPSVDPTNQQHVLSVLAQQHRIWIFAGMRKPDMSKDFNALYAFSPHGNEIRPYEKMHIFSDSHAREDLHFQPGNEPRMVKIDDVQLGLSICFDLRFPALYRSYAKAGAEVLVVVSAWPRIRIADWQLLLRARALENQACVIGVNYCGSRGDLTFGGKSMVCGPDGGILAEADEEHPAVLVVDVDVNQIRQVRRSFPVLQYDRDIAACRNG